MSRASALLVTAALLGGCSSSGGAAAPAKATSQLLLGAPAPGTTACQALPRRTVERLYGAHIKLVRDARSPRPTQTLQTGCVVSIAGEKATSLAVFLWYGDKIKDQWGDEVNAVGTDGFSEQPYGVEAYGIVKGTATELDIAQRHFAVRLVCGPSPVSPTKPMGLAACERLAEAMDLTFPHT